MLPPSGGDDDDDNETTADVEEHMEGEKKDCRYKRKCEFQELVDQKKKKRWLEQWLYSPDVSDSLLNPSSETVAEKGG
nr:unnamed protein product [Spirometra erinaceieuropaei]